MALSASRSLSPSLHDRQLANDAGKFTHYKLLLYKHSSKKAEKTVECRKMTGFHISLSMSVAYLQSYLAKHRDKV